MELRILELDGGLGCQRRLGLDGARTVEAQAWGPRIRLGCAWRRFRAFERFLGEALGPVDDRPHTTLFGSGDFHHVSLALLRRLPGPFNLLILDKHPDWMWGVPFLHCGTWVAHALKMSNVRHVFHLGGDLDFDNARFPIQGGLLQRRGGTVRHDAVAWGYARGADMHGVDIIQHCEVTGIRRENGKVVGVETTRGFIGCKKLGLAAAGNSSEVAAMAGLKLPIESHVLQAFVSEGLKPFIDGVVTFGAGHFYVSQSDKGGLVFGGDIDGYNSYARRGNLPMVEHVVEAGVAMIPAISRVRVLRSWGGIMDMSMDGSPIIDKTSVDGLYLNAGWCYGGFKATPASGFCFAHLIAKDQPQATATAYRLDRFRRGYMIDEKGQGATPNLH